MASAAITWTPGGGANIISQEVNYRIYGTTSWTSAVTGLSSTASSYTITGLADNTLYEFDVVSDCSIGGPISSGIMQGIKWYCPTISATATHNTVSYNFSALSGSISGYTVQLMDSGLTTVIQTLTTITGVFTSGTIAPSTNYKIRLILAAGVLTHTCTPETSIATIAAPTCPTPTLTGATLT